MQLKDAGKAGEREGTLKKEKKEGGDRQFPQPVATEGSSWGPRANPETGRLRKTTAAGGE